MSRWRAGKLKLTCSIEILKKILTDIMPEWEKYIEVSEEGSLTIYGTKNNGNQEGFHIRIASQQNPEAETAPGLSGGDIGLRRKGKEWELLCNNYTLPEKARNLSGKLKQGVATLKVKKLAQRDGNMEIGDVKQGKLRKIRMVVPVGSEYTNLHS